MKTSVSIPDDLWAEVARPGASPSQVVQEALRAVLASRSDPDDRLRDRASAALLARAPGTTDPDDALERLSGVVEQARRLRELGYAVAIDAAANTPWTDIEQLPATPQLRAALVAWAPTLQSDLPEGFLRALYQSLSDFSDGVDEQGDPLTSPTLYEGVADGIADVFDLVRQRLAGDAVGPSASEAE